MVLRIQFTVIVVFITVQAVIVILAVNYMYFFKYKTSETDTLFMSLPPTAYKFHRDNNKTIGLSYFPNLLKIYDVPKHNSSQIPRVVSPPEYNTLIKLMETVDLVLTLHNISYVLGYGSLIGSYFMHDLLPWDDDVDIMVDNRTKAKIMEIFTTRGHYGLQGYHHYKHGGSIFKVFFNSSSFSGKYPWKWPFIDISSYVEDKDNIKAVERHKNLIIPKRSFYPFHLRPFGPLWLPVPKEPRVFLQANYKGNFQCISSRSNHKTEKTRKVKARLCSQLQSDYAFVERSEYGNRTMESLVLNGRRLYDIVVDEMYAERNKFKW